MNRLNPTTILLLSLGISAFSLIMSIGAVLFATSSDQRMPKQITIPDPKPLIADNPATKLPHADGLRPAGGTVKSASGSEIILTTNNGEQTIAIGPATKLYRQGKQKDAPSYQKEMQAFQDLLKNAMDATEIFVAPFPYETTEASVSDFKSGMQVLALVGGSGTTVQVTIMNDSSRQ